MKKVSSIEYLVNIVQSCIPPNYIPELIIKQAKEMHKQELEAFFEAGMKYGMDISISNDIGCDAEQPNFETFYNETFNK